MITAKSTGWPMLFRSGFSIASNTAFAKDKLLFNRSMRWRRESWTNKKGLPVAGSPFAALCR
ncbi:hypothetical protein [Candidatus Electronema sp. JM]|uniref:hypothetical protein n=1 Tax=Candidatus Electronema sp. JM TaxID=3401571 RepID=UPI003AA8AD1C